MSASDTQALHITYLMECSLMETKASDGTVFGGPKYLFIIQRIISEVSVQICMNISPLGSIVLFLGKFTSGIETI